MTFDKDLLFEEVEDDTDTVDLPGKGTVTVRVLTRKQVQKVRKQVKSIPDAIARQDILERKTLVLAMVDPVVTEDDCARWQAASRAGEIDLVMRKIEEISGMREDYGKRVTEELIEDPEEKFPLLPGAEAS